MGARLSATAMRFQSTAVRSSAGQRGGGGGQGSGVDLDRLAKRRLGGREPGDGDPEGRTRHVIQAGVLEEANRPGIASVLSANADLEVRAHGAATLDAQAHEFPDALGVDADEGVGRKDSLVVVGVEKASRIVARQPIGGLRQIVGPETEKLRAFRDLAGEQAGTRAARSWSRQYTGCRSRSFFITSAATVSTSCARISYSAVTLTRRDHHLGHHLLAVRRPPRRRPQRSPAPGPRRSRGT